MLSPGTAFLLAYLPARWVAHIARLESKVRQLDVSCSSTSIFRLFPNQIIQTGGKVAMIFCSQSQSKELFGGLFLVY